MSRRAVQILGTRGIPARHGGFETFVERLAPYLAERAWDVTVYCQTDGERERIDEWRGVRRVEIPSKSEGSLGSIVFDWHSTARAAGEPGVKLICGYNTALFTARLRAAGRPVLINMDGIEWRRGKWSAPVRFWFYVNEWIAARVADRLIADHEKIAEHLAHVAEPGRISTIPYGADRVDEADARYLAPLGLRKREYALVVARPEPENSVLEIVRAFVRRARPIRLVVLGAYDAKQDYQRSVLEAGGDRVLFPGAIYERSTVDALRAHASVYVHGHRVGGTNPALVEALGAGAAVVARDNPYNRGVCRRGAVYFRDEDDLDAKLGPLIADEPRLERLRRASRERHRDAYTWEAVLARYEALLAEWA